MNKVNTTIPDYIYKLDKPSELRKVINNAKVKNREDIVAMAFRRLCEVQGVNYDDPLHRDFYTMLAAYEEALAEKYGKAQKATYTRRKLAKVGVEKCMEDWAIKEGSTQGFIMLVSRGMVDLTAEAMVVKHSDRFSNDVVSAARKKLDQASVSVVNS